MPLPCSPASTSERGDTSQSQSAYESESGDSLVTPRPGPAAPEQRTVDNLSTPLPAFNSFSSERKEFRYPSTSEASEDDIPSRLQGRPPVRPSSSSNAGPRVYIPSASEPSEFSEASEDDFPSRLQRRPSSRPSIEERSPVSSTIAAAAVAAAAAAAATAATITSSTSAATPALAPVSAPSHASQFVGKEINSEAEAHPPFTILESGSASGVEKSENRSQANTRPSLKDRKRSSKRSLQGRSELTATRSLDNSPRGSPMASPGQSPKHSPKHSPKQSPKDGPAVPTSERLTAPIPFPESSRRSVTFSPQASLRPEGNSYGAYIMARRSSPGASPHGTQQVSEETESSADENTAIFRRSNSKTGVGTSGAGYGTSVLPYDGAGVVAGYDGAGEEEVGGLRDLSPVQRRRKSSSSKAGGAKDSRPGSLSAPRRSSGAARDDEDSASDNESWWKSLVDNYGSVELENKGSTARDHLALERTFLAWLRTSLSFASIGIAVTQLFRLNSSIRSSSGETSIADISQSDMTRLRQVGKPLGATFLGISILILLLGFHRYFESQHYVIRGKFPASRFSIVLVSVVAAALIIISLVVVIAVAPSALN